MYLFSFFPLVLMMKKTVKKLTDTLASAIWREENDRQIECATVCNDASKSEMLAQKIRTK